MTKLLASLYAFNRGIADPLFFGRPDVKRLALSAAMQTNWMPRVLGPMMLRPGWEYTGATLNDNKALHLPFIYATNDTALIEFTDSNIRVKVNEVAINRPAVASAITNGDFNTDLSGWTDDDEAGGTSSWVTGGYLSLVGDGTDSAIRSQQVTVASGDQNVQHALRIIVNRGPIVLKVGISDGDDSYIETTTLGTGTHSLALTPTGDFWVQVSSNKTYASLVDSIEVETAGDMVLPSPYPESVLGAITFDESADIIELACYGYQQRKIERRGVHSWSIVLFEPVDGPFNVINITPITLTPSDIAGDITVTASKPLFRSTHVGALFKISSIGQQVTETVSAPNVFSDPIRISGLNAGGGRQFNIDITGTWVGTVTLQRSIADPGSWTDVATYTGDTSTTFSDGLDNQIVYYRIGIKTGNYTSGSAITALAYPAGSIDGVVKITGFTDNKTVSAKVVKNLGGTTGVDTWYEGQWSDYRGYPSAVVFYEGRLFWAGKSYIWGSVSDAFESYDDSVEGDSGPINRTIGSGPVDDINWLLPLQRMLLGTPGAEKSARSTSFDDPLTPTNFNIKNATTQGSAKVPAVIVDNLGYFVHRSTNAMYEMKLDTSNYLSLDYTSTKSTIYAPAVAASSFLKLVVQRQPDTRIHAVRADGKVAIFIADEAEDVKCWILVQTDGIIEDVVVLPGTSLEDTVYYCVNRTINGNTVRYLEKWSLESECIGGTLNKQADSFVIFNQAASTTITGIAPHLIGQEVIIWGDGKDMSPGSGSNQTLYLVDGTGSISGLPIAVSQGIVGLPYNAQFQSVKLAFANTANGPMMVHTALTQRKRINQLALLMQNTHYQGLQYGRDFNTMDDLPLVENELLTPPDTIWADYDKDAMTFPGDWDTDSRLCLQANAPRPCTMIGALIGIDVSAKV